MFGNETTEDVGTDVLIVGAGPVGMLQALILARIHNQPCTIIEREQSTTKYPKMEYTNGRSMEIYRALGLSESLRAVGNSLVPEHFSLDEIVVTSPLKGGKLVHHWERDGPADQRQKSYDFNNGSQYLEPHMRCNQVAVEAWLKEQIDAEPLITGYWGTTFLQLREEANSVIVEASRGGKKRIRFESKYVIGADGGGSQVRKAANLVSKREPLVMTMCFVHFKSSQLRDLMPFPRAWHTYICGGGGLVNQNEKDLWTVHVAVPPGVDAATMTDEDILGLGMGGCLGKVQVPYEEIHSRGIWRADVGIADSFLSSGGRVLLAGDAAHQLSPIGGHGLNSGLGDAFDIGWKLAATLKGWGGPNLLPSYDAERKQVAHENLGYATEAFETTILPMLSSLDKYGVEVFNGDSAKSRKARQEVSAAYDKGYWMHDQNGNILGATYKDSTIIIEESGDRPRSTHQLYVPTTWPGSRAPHVWMGDGVESTLDSFDYHGFNIVDFSKDVASSGPFVLAAQQLNVPLKQIQLSNELVKTVYERDLVLIRPDGYVAWRSPVDHAEPLTTEQAHAILSKVTGHT